MTIDKKIKELEEKLEEIKKENEERKEGLYAKYERWRAKFVGKYYYINSCGEIEISLENITAVDNYRHTIGNYFQTEKQAGIIQQNRLTYQQLKDIALRLNKGRKFDWNDLSQRKYYIYFDFKANELKQWEADLYKILNVIYCRDEDFLDIALEEIGEERLKQLLEWGV